MSREQQLADGLRALGIALPATVQAQLLAYAAFLEKWNRTYSLTALRDPALAVSHHLLDSLAILPYVDAASLLDVGSGGGQPGIPLAIARPELAVTLVDSNSKKTAFLQQAAIELGLKNVQVVTARVETFAPAAPFAAITSRAFAELADFVALTRHLLAPGGAWLAMKGVRPDAEMNKLPADVAVAAVHRLDVPGVDGERHLVVIRER
ncbi:16S rRNA (guanine(527)-N(7))-methyltransferase RsmG [Azospira restricta]|uniref:Ribosomal RNA small subunit methyltransferase G n=1 Tax=Azospira restricta TaxID=404405 RepID=A0A974SQ18_9RHOO|nr:16S rRNA (guanine(527)-N(7))-methyltransferase RsmG [Azospira restricta]QRJ64352.1 16S rRNA (guanine(527)-N(7))-methyltransferase RsmG [Azospira restricta]